jgi:hypothetical protein
MSISAAVIAQNQWAYVGTYLNSKWFIDTESIKYETRSIISFQIKADATSHFHMKLNCSNRTFSQAYQPYETAGNAKNVVTALLDKLCFTSR